ncbi:hypothetical protein, variant 1 [Aphanomyces astaci]|uniref:Uncharacterized protein n=1 Tax=Aphanomyces astaci TaxID=112090 RepID=W4H1A1_APHAT|nr:hypothetical protein, variant 1 [Aphanomyces astaci]ETV85790.1 hypothetical protein, variant 1 [Aphanomyces astaci]|eukprot:XP_009824266.1 hypothetical protein, variant 1 [Aphanomyces astaci]
MKRANSPPVPPPDGDPKRTKACYEDRDDMKDLSSLSLDDMDDDGIGAFGNMDHDALLSQPYQAMMQSPEEGWPDDNDDDNDLPNDDGLLFDQGHAMGVPLSYSAMSASAFRSSSQEMMGWRLSSPPLSTASNRRISLGPVHISAAIDLPDSSCSAANADTMLDDELSAALSPEDEVQFHHVVYYLQLHPKLVNQLSRRQLNAFRAAGLLQIEVSARRRSVTITREMLTSGPMAFMFPHYKAFFSSNHVTFQWQATASGVDLTLTNTSRHPLFVGLQVLPPQQTKALALHDEIRLLVSPAKFLLLGYVVTNHEIPPPPHPPCHNVLGVLFAHPILNYSSLGLSLNNRDVHTMHTSMSTRLVKYMQMSELRVNETGLPVTFTPQPVDLAVEFASWDVLTDLVADGCQMLHVACAATSSALILEDGRGGAFSVDVDQLTRLFRGSAVQVVQISVYHNGCPTAHQLLLDAGVPYVVAVAPHTRVVPSSQLLCFSTNFYRALMSGKSIQTSFHLAKHSTRLPSDTFCLYAQSNGHHGMEVLYPLTDKPKATPTFRSVLRKGSLSFAVCKEFTHRLNEAHDICYRLLDPLHHTRFIDIHGPPGIGKTQLALAVTQYVSFRGTFDGGIRVLHVKDVVERKGAQHAVVWLQRIFMDIKDNSGRAKSFLVVLDGVEVFFHTPYHAVVVLDFVPAILNEMPNVTIVATTLQAVALSSSPSFKQFHVGLDSNPGGLFTVHFHALSSDSSLDDTTRLPHENYDTAHEPASPTNAVAAAAPANCCIM